VLLSGTAAYAGTSWTNFDVLAPRLQQGVNVAFQDKEGGFSTESQAAINSVGSSYRVNLRTVRSGNTQYGTERKGLSPGFTYNLNSPFAAGARVGLQIHNSTWAAVNVQVTGRFRTN